MGIADPLRDQVQSFLKLVPGDVHTDTDVDAAAESGMAVRMDPLGIEPVRIGKCGRIAAGKRERHGDKASLGKADAVIIDVLKRGAEAGGDRRIAEGLFDHLRAIADVLGATLPVVGPVQKLIDDHRQHVLGGVVAGEEQDQDHEAELDIIHLPAVPDSDEGVEQGVRVNSAALLAFEYKLVRESPQCIEGGHEMWLEIGVERQGCDLRFKCIVQIADGLARNAQQRAHHRDGELSRELRKVERPTRDPCVEQVGDDLAHHRAHLPGMPRGECIAHAIAQTAVGSARRGEQHLVHEPAPERAAGLVEVDDTAKSGGELVVHEHQVLDGPLSVDHIAGIESGQPRMLRACFRHERKWVLGEIGPVYRQIGKVDYGCVFGHFSNPSPGDPRPDFGWKLRQRRLDRSGLAHSETDASAQSRIS